MLNLHDVTLVMIETREHELAALAVKDCLARASFGDVLIFTDKATPFQITGVSVRFIEVPDWPDKIGWSRFHWQEVAPHVSTSYALTIQWDSWIVNPDIWHPEFLQYDYCGAPWPWHKDRKVGNGGFSLRSTALMRYLRKHRDRFPCTTPADDDLLCRKYRYALEEVGFVWAPESVATDFAFECEEQVEAMKHFGFHACQNFVKVLDHDRLLERAKLMQQSAYIGKQDGYLWQNFCKSCPDIITELGVAGAG